MRRHVKSTILATGLVLILGSLFIQSCCKPPLPPPPPPVEEEKDPTLEISFPEEKIPYGEKDIVLSWTTTNTKNLYINGIKRSGESHTILERLFQDTTFLFKAINVKKETEKEITLNVGDWTTSVFGLVSYYPWRYKALSVTSIDDSLLDYWIPEKEVRSWVFYYYQNGIMTVSDEPADKAPWFIKNDSTIVINRAERRLQVDEKEMTISYEIVWGGQPAWFNMIFEHASTIPTDP